MTYFSEQIRLLRANLSRQYAKSDCNVSFHDNADVTEILKNSIGTKTYRIATAGYSFEQEGYEDITINFLRNLDKILKHKNTGYITTPALYPGSIYDITTRISGIRSNNVVYFTTQQYWQSTDLDRLNSNIRMKKYSKVPIHVFPDTQTYLEATANASNILICTGGRNLAVAEIVEALKQKNKVILLINENLKNEAFDKNSKSIECAPKYFLDYISKYSKDVPSINGLDTEFLRTHPGRPLHLLKIYFVSDKESTESTALLAANFIKSRTAYDYWPDKTDETDKKIVNASRKYSHTTIEKSEQVDPPYLLYGKSKSTQTNR